MITKVTTQFLVNKSRRNKLQSAKKSTEDDRRRSKAEEAAKREYEENLKPDSDDEKEEWRCEYLPKEGMYVHHTYETVYPEYILVIEPIPKTLQVSDKNDDIQYLT